jgi:dihydrofolate reductase
MFLQQVCQASRQPAPCLICLIEKRKMRPLRLYIALSLDGYIAPPDGSVDWLSAAESPDEDYGYAQLLSGVDTTFMGYRTYAQILGFGDFPYGQLQNFVFTRQQRQPDGLPVTFITEDPATFTRRLKAEPGGDIWLIGGGQLNALLHQAGLIDELILTYVPVVLGAGIPLFAGAAAPTRWALISQRHYPKGVWQGVYRPKKQA